MPLAFTSVRSVQNENTLDFEMTSGHMKCKICNGESVEQFTAKVLGKYDVRYYLCSRCSFLQTEDPYWLNEAYRNPINLTDTDVVNRSLFFSKIVTALICLHFEKSGRFLDYGGGYGLFTRLMRDVGFDYYLSDPITENLFARGFDGTGHGKKFELITSFETLEHFADPMKEIATMLELSSNIFFSTETLPIPVPSLADWYFYGPTHGQHVSFYSRRTFNTIAGLLHLNYYTNGTDLHFLTKTRMSPAGFRFIMRYGKLLYLILKKQMKTRTATDSVMLSNNSES